MEDHPNVPNTEAIAVSPRDALMIEIESRQQLSNILNQILHPNPNQGSHSSTSETTEEFRHLNQLLSPCTKYEWDRRTSTCLPQVKAIGRNANEEKIFELEGPERTSYLCNWFDSGELRLPYSFNDLEIIHFSNKPKTCFPCCGTSINELLVYIPGRDDPIGKIVYTNGHFADNSVTITNFLTGETFLGVPEQNARQMLPIMTIKGTAGLLRTIAVCAVTHGHVYKGTLTYTGVSLQLSRAGVPASTKALMLILGCRLMMIRFNIKWPNFFSANGP